MSVSSKQLLDIDVFEAALQRLTVLYSAGHRVVCTFSAGKDSGVCLELCILAARATDRLPVDVIMRDEEIMFPGTYEYAERTATRPEINFHWVYANQPIINAFNRAEPYWWVFDPLLQPEQWVRQPPSYAYHIPDKNIEHLVTHKRFPPEPGKNLYCVIGLRVEESRKRMLGLMSSKSYITCPNRLNVYNVRPIYDWVTPDVWKAVYEHRWDYNEAYDVMYRMGIDQAHMRIAPPTLQKDGIHSLSMAQRAWPQWFEKVATRLPGVRTAANFGIRAVTPQRKANETWQDCFLRECIDEAPAEWIRLRAQHVYDTTLQRRARHSTLPLPDNFSCPQCGTIRSFQQLCLFLYSGDPFALRTGNMWNKTRSLSPTSPLRQYIEPEFFRPGDGIWDGKPQW